MNNEERSRRNKFAEGIAIALHTENKPFPSLLQSAEDERRLQLEDRADWIQPGDPPTLPFESEADYNERTGRYEQQETE